MTDLVTYLKTNAQVAQPLTPEEEQKLAKVYQEFKKSLGRYKDHLDRWRQMLDVIVEIFGQEMLTEHLENFKSNKGYKHTESPFYQLDVLLQASRVKPTNPRLDFLFEIYLAVYKADTLHQFLDLNKEQTDELVTTEHERLLASDTNYLMLGVLADKGEESEGVIKEWLAEDEGNLYIPRAYYLAHVPVLANFLVKTAKEMGKAWDLSRRGLGLFFENDYQGNDYQGADCFVDSPMIGASIIATTLMSLENHAPHYFETLDHNRLIRDYNSKGELGAFELGVLATSEALASPGLEDDPRRIKAILERSVLTVTAEDWIDLAISECTLEEQIELVRQNANLLTYDRLERMLRDCISYHELLGRLFDDMVWQAEYCVKMKALVVDVEVELVRDFLERIELAGYGELIDHLQSIAEDQETLARVIYRLSNTGEVYGISKAEADFMGRRWGAAVKEQSAYHEEGREFTDQVLETLYDDDVVVEETQRVSKLIETIIDGLAVAQNDQAMEAASHEIID